MNVVGVQLKRYRNKIGWSQQRLSEEVGIPQTTISDFENGRYLPDVIQAISLAKIFGISVYNFIEEEQSA
ncbi:helix-turn-helix transcriptional regulator [Hazenella sp. IB182357]|uniref:Helix-turn-helix transcriptional regulator n=1 Tax=Polycladospora coralii TaxID=2771432 RepID=A0A926NBD3_9BACL|nr:helix-turn-helix transcriptional regulator [Polycladospora coralii]MBD1373776.1 helix-turn-helix transcriptional regulator [Polycladospora coralii]